MLRIFLFLATNLAILVLASATLRLLGVGHYIDAQGLNFTALLIWCGMFGFIGAFISLFLSKFMAKRFTRTKIIEQPTGADQQWLVSTVADLAKQSGIGMPEVGIFPGQSPNAFATGYNRNKALVAVNTAMLQRFGKTELRAVLAHEIGHVANGDMITLTLIQGVVNTFVMFFARIIGFFIDRFVFRNEHGVGIGFYLTVIVTEIVLAILASTIVMWFSRRREFHADAWGAKLAGSAAMISALEMLRTDTRAKDMPKEMLAFGISSDLKHGLARAFSSHPPLEARIAALKANSVPA